MLQALSCVKVETKDNGDQVVVTFNQENGLYTEWPVIDNGESISIDKANGVSYMLRTNVIIEEYKDRHMLLEPTLNSLRSDVLNRVQKGMENYALAMSKRANLKNSMTVYKPLMEIDYAQDMNKPLSTF